MPTVTPTSVLEESLTFQLEEAKAEIRGLKKECESLKEKMIRADAIYKYELEKIKEEAYRKELSLKQKLLDYTEPGWDI